MKPVCLSLCIVLSLAACKPQVPAPVAPAPTPEAVAAPAPPHEMDIGDVEATIRIEGTLAEQSRAPNVNLEEFRTRREHLTQATITIEPPVREHLFLSFEVKTSQGFRETPVALRVSVLAKEDEAERQIGKFATVVANVVQEPAKFKLDILGGGPAPNSLLVYAKAEAILTPKGTDPASVNPETVAGQPDRVTTIIGNPIRIEFQAAPGGAGQ